MMDGNEIIGDEDDGIIKLIEKTDFVDYFPLLHGERCNISTCSRRNTNPRRIDYILTSVNMTPFIRRCGYLPFLYSLTLIIL